jgi:hypothetical protein
LLTGDGQRPPSRAVRALAEAPTSPCSHCGRESKTVTGVCADCWGVKEPDSALDLRPKPTTEPLFDRRRWAGDWIPVGAFALAAIAVVAILVRLFLGLA